MTDHESTAKTCHQASCSCPVEGNAKYCSAACEGAGETLQLDCDCGHDACQGNF